MYERDFARKELVKRDLEIAEKSLTVIKKFLEIINDDRVEQLTKEVLVKLKLAAIVEISKLEMTNGLELEKEINQLSEEIEIERSLGN